MHLGDGGTGWISSSDLLVWNRLERTDALMSHTTASKARRTRVTFRREASPLRRDPNQNLLVILRILLFMPCHATHMMKKVGLPPTARRRDPTCLVRILLSASTPKQRRWSTMLGDLLPMGSFWGSWVVSRVRREAGSLMRMAMPWSLVEPKLSVVRNLPTR